MWAPPVPDLEGLKGVGQSLTSYGCPAPWLAGGLFVVLGSVASPWAETAVLVLPPVHPPVAVLIKRRWPHASTCTRYVASI